MLDTVSLPLNETLNCVVELMAEGLDYEIADTAPGTYRELVNHMNSGKMLLIYSGGSDYTIFGDPSVNHAFRAWHDHTHFTYGYDFSPVGEMFTCNQQITDIIDVLGSDVAQQCMPLLIAEIIGQSLYYKKYKEYINDQRAFALAYMQSPQETLKSKW
jgi:hypothetical protein